MTTEEAVERLEIWEKTAQENVDSFERVFPDQKSIWREDVECFNMAISALTTTTAENTRLRAELERVKREARQETERLKSIMRDNGIMAIPSRYPGGTPEWNIPRHGGTKKGGTNETDPV